MQTCWQHLAWSWMGNISGWYFTKAVAAQEIKVDRQWIRSKPFGVQKGGKLWSSAVLQRVAICYNRNMKQTNLLRALKMIHNPHAMWSWILFWSFGEVPFPCKKVKYLLAYPKANIVNPCTCSQETEPKTDNERRIKLFIRYGKPLQAGICCRV